MFGSVGIFLDFNLPNATTWLYFSFLLAVALYFKFSRVFSFRNWDVVTIFLLAPGLLLLQGPKVERAAAPSPRAIAAAVGAGTMPLDSVVLLARDSTRLPTNWHWLGYLWLICGSGYFFARCVFDLVLVQRPALGPNLTLGGLAWLGTAMFLFLMVVAFRQPDRFQTQPLPTSEGIQSTSTMVGKESALFAIAQQYLATRPWMTRAFAGLCHFLVVVGLIVVCGRHFKDPALGIAVATFYLLVPYTSFYVSQAHHAWPTAMVVWALAVFRFPMLAGLLLGLGTGTMYFPALLFPIWFSFYWRRGAWRFALAFLFAVVVCLGAVAIDLWVAGSLEQSLREVWQISPWNSPEKTHSEGFWTGVHFAYRIPIFVGHLAFVLATFFWPGPKNLAHVIALSAAVLIGLQFWYADQGGVYVLWYLPLMLLMVFRPNLSECRPETILADRDWLTRWRRFVLRWLLWRRAAA